MLDFAPLPTAASAKHAEMIEEFKIAMLARHARVSPGDVEVKLFSVQHYEGDSATYFVLEVGTVGDEGTLAALFCRDYRHIRIGKAGGLKLLNAKNKRKNQGWFHALHALTRR
jgi:hypothetical protein